MVSAPLTEINSTWLSTDAGHIRFLCERAGGGALFVSPGSSTIQQIDPQPSTAAAIIVALQFAKAGEGSK